MANPPEKPILNSPEDGQLLYFTWKDSVCSPDFKWSLGDWGWSPIATDPKSYTLVLEKEDGSLNMEELISGDKNEFKFNSKLPDGTYEWSVAAKLGTYEGLHADKKSFRICTIDRIPDINASYPPNEGYIPEKNVTLVWTEPEFGSPCANQSLYNYKITVYKEGASIVEKDAKRGENNITISLGEEEVYTWTVVANGPAGVSSQPVINKFTICTKQKPGTPSSFKIDNFDAEHLCKESEVMSYKFSWGAPESGKNCYQKVEDIEINYTIQACTEEGCLENETITETEYYWDIKCGTMSYNITIWAYNGYDYSQPDTIPFSVCQKTPPAKPVIADIPMNYCRKTTEVTWNLAELGSYCVNSEANNTFELVFTKGRNITRRTVPYIESGTYSKDYSLGEGEWNLTINAISKNNLSSSSDPKRFNASVVPNFKNTYGEYIGGNKAELHWEMDANLLGCLDNTKSKIVISYTCKGIDHSEVLEITNKKHTISDVDGEVDWEISLVQDGEVLLHEESMFDTNENCTIRYPSWDDPNDVLISPGDNEPVFGIVTFSWNGAKPGVACIDNTKARRDLVVDNNAKKGYYVFVDGNNETSETTIHSMEIEKPGNHTWYVVAFVGDVKSNKSNSKIFCLTAPPPDPEILEYDPYNPNIVSWKKVQCKITQST